MDFVTRPSFTFRRETGLPDIDAVVDLYKSCTLGARRPVDDRQRMLAMLKGANLIITAWDAQQLIGIARSLSDFSYVTYLSDLAVRESHQSLGIGKELLRRTQEAGGSAVHVVLIAAPGVDDYYRKLGLESRTGFVLVAH